eukprot:g844.t1
MQEFQRIKATRISATGGGDGTPTRLDLFPAAILDYSGNPAPAQFDVAVIEIPDTVPPTIDSAVLDLNDGTLVITASETLDLASPTSIADLSKLFLQNTLQDTIPLQGAFIYRNDSQSVTVILTETQRAGALRGSATVGGDGTALLIDVYANAFLDIGANPNLQSGNRSVTEIPDSTQPFLLSATIDFGYGTLLLDCSETVNKLYTLNLSALYVSNTTGSRDLNFEGAVPIESSETTLKLKITEPQRLQATFYSGTKSGDGIPSTFMNDVGALYDLALNPMNAVSSVNLTEIRDTVPPFLVSVRLELGTGTLYLVASETLKTVHQSIESDTMMQFDNENPNIFLNLSSAKLSNASVGASDEELFNVAYVDLEPASFQPKFTLTITILLTESQRADAVRLSGTPGGDGNATVLSLPEGALKDLEELTSNATIAVAVTEIADNILPNVSRVILDYSLGVITFMMTETMDITPVSNVALAKLFLSNSSGNRTIPLDGKSSSVTGEEGTNVTIALDEGTRVAAVRTSSFSPNGDGSTPVVDVLAGALIDIGQNEILAATGLEVLEIPDRDAPIITIVSLNYSTGDLQFFFDETLDITPISRLDVGAFAFSDTLIVASPLFALDGLGGAAIVSDIADTDILKFDLNEEQRNALLVYSGVPGGDGTAAAIGFESDTFVDLFLNGNNKSSIHLTEHPDVVPPTLVATTIYLGEGGAGCGFLRCGLVTFRFSEYIDLNTSHVDLTKAFFGNSNNATEAYDISLTGAIVTNIEKYELNVTLTEKQRTEIIAISGTPGGDNISVVMSILDGFVADRSGLRMRAVSGQEVLEFADHLKPNVTHVILDLNDGKITVTADETIDVTPRDKMLFGRMFFANNTGDKAVPFTSDTKLLMPNGDEPVVIFQLTERQRANTIAISGQSGGDNIAALFDVVEGALRDVAQNTISNTSLTAVEVPDTTPPVLHRVEYNYMTGVVSFVCSEIVDLTPTSRVNFTAFRIVDWLGGYITDMRISENATLDMDDNATFHIKLEPYQRWATLDVGDYRHAEEQKGTDVPGIDDALQIEVDAGAFTDIALNPVNRTNTSMTDPTKSFVIRYIGETVVFKGSNEHAVVNYTKKWYFNGTGINKVPGMLDTAKWVPYSFTTKSHCGSGDQYARGDLVGPSVTDGGAFRVLFGGAPIAFTTPLIDHTQPYKLCYMFGDEPWKLFDVFVYVNHLTQVLKTTVGVSGQASVGETKPFKVTGYGPKFGDRVNWARFNAQLDEECNTAPNLTTNMHNMIPGTNFVGDQVQNDLTFTVNFTQPSVVYLPHKLCYGFGIEPLKLYHGAETSVHAKSVQETTSQYSIVNVNISVTVFSPHITGFNARYGDVGEVDPLVKDRIKWVVGVERDDRFQNLQAYDNINCNDGPAPGTHIAFVTRNPTLPIGVAQFLFTVPYDDGTGALQPVDAAYVGTRLRLCYAFGSEDFHLYYGQTMLPILPRMDNASANVAVQGVDKTVTFSGSLGITTGDRTKWVKSTDSCDTLGFGGMNDVETKVVGGDDPRTYATYTFDDALLDGHLLTLCYQFGDGPFVPFRHITMQIKRIDNVTLMEGSSVDTLVGAPLTMFVDGIGIMDGDTIVLVPSGFGCDAIPAGGSSPGTVSERKASFVFDSEAADISLCYQFQDEPFKAYPDIPLVKKVPEAEEVAINQRVLEVKLSLTLDIDVTTITSDPTFFTDPMLPARIEFETSFKSDLSSVLGITPSRIVINSISQGSIVIDFTILPSLDGSEVMAEQAALILEEQITDPNSPLNTSPTMILIQTIDKVKTVLPLPIVVSISTLPEVVAAQNESAFAINVLQFQTSGLFSFMLEETVVVENQEIVNITVVRNHGTAGVVRVGVKSIALTANPRASNSTDTYDYEDIELVVNFTEGEASKTVSVILNDDATYEKTFETVSIQLSLQPNEGALTYGSSALGSQKETILKVYDYGDGATAVASSFNATGGYLSYLQGWGIIGNGVHSPVWVDDKGLYSVDQAFMGRLSSRPLCEAGVSVESAIILQCDIPCDATNTTTSYSENPSVFADPTFTAPMDFNGSGYVASAGAIHDFPDSDITVSMWIRTTDVQSAGTLLAFYPSNATNTSLVDATTGATIPFYEFALYDQRALRLAVADHSDLTWRHPTVETGVAVNDGTWHHVALTWASNTGAVQLWVDGANKFSHSGGYRTDHVMQRQGTLVIGNSIVGNCDGPKQYPCDLLSWKRGFTGVLQNIRVYTEVLGASGVLDDLRWPFVGASNLQLKIYWRTTAATFVNGAPNASVVNGASGSMEKYSTVQRGAHAGVLSIGGVAPMNTATVRTPCVEDDIWYFKAPPAFVGDISYMYNGRLQFEMMAPAAAGYARSRNGMVYLTGGNGMTLGNSMVGFGPPTSSGWSPYSIPFREDQGWSHFDDLNAVTFKQFRTVLANVTGVYFRGDDRVCSSLEEGEEAVYINNIRYETNPLV